MAKFEKGNMWDVFGKTDLFLITTNPIVKKNGAVVMGRGIAAQAKDRFPQLPFDFGHMLSFGNAENTGIIGAYGDQLIGYFMVKDHWARPADILIIEDSVSDLNSYAREYDRIDLNFPGIGNGKLKREHVLPSLDSLPDNVHIWEYNG